MGKAAIKKQQKERALLNAAFNLFLKNGIRNTSISDITEKAGVAKGTFYLYFKDKFDIRDKLVASKAADIFENAYKAMEKLPVADGEIEEKILFLVEHSVDQLCNDKRLMHFIATNLEWAVFSSSDSKKEEGDFDVVGAYEKILTEVKEKYRNVEIMLFMIIELTIATCYNAAIYGEPVTIEELKPELFSTIKVIMNNYRNDGN